LPTNNKAFARVRLLRTGFFRRRVPHLDDTADWMIITIIRYKNADRDYTQLNRARRLDPAEFAARCKASGLAVTPQRLAIIETLMQADDHPRAEEIFARVRRRHPHISLATVHRTLETLCRIGEARKVTLLHDSARYDGNLEPHQHVICVRCRRIEDVRIGGVERLLDENGPIAGYTALGCALEIRAICDRCRSGNSAASEFADALGLANGEPPEPRGKTAL
jgi:Fe2+ or Zn2+ uptake regulation protein